MNQPANTPNSPPNAPPRSDRYWQALAEHRIQQAQEEGQFDKLPGFGKPLPDLGDPNDELWWVRQKLQREQVSALPPGLQLRLDVAQAVEQLWLLRSEQTVRDEIERLNAMIRKRNYEILWGPPANVMPLDPESLVDEWRERQVPPGADSQRR